MRVGDRPASGSGCRPEAATVPMGRVGQAGRVSLSVSASPSNLIKAASDEGGGSGSGKPQKNLTGSKPVAQNNTGAPESLLRRREVTEEEAER